MDLTGVLRGLIDVG